MKFRALKTPFFAGAIFLSIATTAYSANKYVTDTLYVPIRSAVSAGTPVATLKSGDQVTVLSEDAATGFSKVKTADGKEGWIKSTYLMDQKIAREELEALKKRLETYENSQGSSKGVIDSMKEELTSLKGSAETLQKENTALKGELEHIKSISGQSVELDKKNKQLEGDQKALQEKITELTSANAKLSGDTRNEGIKLGISAIVFGLFIGVLLSYLKPPKRREGSVRLR
jgi:SH3 domain protein